uniref:Uncharacterized protein n=1 Tax=Amphimedon queenslandica TaxID=400682 RepID=A0A1X7TS96_AMPQE
MGAWYRSNTLVMILLLSLLIATVSSQNSTSSGPSGFEVAFAIVGGLFGVIIIVAAFLLILLGICVFFGLVPFNKFFCCYD